MLYTYEYPRASVTVDIVVFCKFDDILKVLLIQRGNEPFRDQWAFPGGFIEMEETLLNTAQRELEEETGLKGIDLRQFKTYGDPGRDPRGRTVTIIFYGFAEPKNSSVTGADDAKNAGWFAVDKIPILAFDHQKILDDLLDMINTAE
ncbi:MAG: NUDIX hydrolase [Bacteroidales bacterium]|nr:NUDIX hydrolase [Bacteroidales bacterium]